MRDGLINRPKRPPMQPTLRALTEIIDTCFYLKRLAGSETIARYILRELKLSGYVMIHKDKLMDTNNDTNNDTSNNATRSTPRNIDRTTPRNTRNEND